jgi:hypothetical protein
MRFSYDGSLDNGEDRPEEADNHRGNGRADTPLEIPGSRLTDEDIDVHPGAAIDEFLQEILKAFGGPRGLARQSFSEFKSAPEGGNVRRTFIDRLMCLMETKSKTNPPRDLEDIPLDVLKAEAQELLREVKQ